MNEWKNRGKGRAQLQVCCYQPGGSIEETTCVLRLPRYEQSGASDRLAQNGKSRTVEEQRRDLAAWAQTQSLCVQ
jgi:hypothetical protein